MHLVVPKSSLNDHEPKCSNHSMQDCSFNCYFRYKVLENKEQTKKGFPFCRNKQPRTSNLARDCSLLAHTQGRNIVHGEASPVFGYYNITMTARAEVQDEVVEPRTGRAYNHARDEKDRGQHSSSSTAGAGTARSRLTDAVRGEPCYVDSW
jgi:hypothetical protein